MRKLTQDTIIARFRAKHGDKYDYSLVNFIGVSYHVTVICPKHGQYRVSPRDHIKHGCKECARESMPIRRWSDDKINSLFNDNGFTVLNIIRTLGKDISVQTKCRQNHISTVSLPNFKKSIENNKIGCSHCAANVKHTQDYIENCLTAEGYVAKEEYINSRTPFQAVCPNGHMCFINYSSWKRGSRCSECADRGFKLEKPAILYYIKFYTKIGVLYKIGITNLSTQIRFRYEPCSFQIIKEEHFLLGKLAKEKEREILTKYKDWLYKGDYVLKNGNTECFTKDVLGLDI